MNVHPLSDRPNKRFFFAIRGLAKAILLNSAIVDQILLAPLLQCQLRCFRILIGWLVVLLVCLYCCACFLFLFLTGHLPTHWRCMARVNDISGVTNRYGTALGSPSRAPQTFLTRIVLEFQNGSLWFRYLGMCDSVRIGETKVLILCPQMCVIFNEKKNLKSLRIAAMVPKFKFFTTFSP